MQQVQERVRELLHPIPLDEDKTGVIARGFSVLSDTQNSWRRLFLFYRVLYRFRGRPFLGRVEKSAERKIHYELTRSPRFVAPYLRFLHQHQGRDVTQALIDRLVLPSTLTGAIAAEIANYFFSVGLVGEGDDMLTEAKRLDSTYTRIFEIEAWNQRQRENLHQEKQAVQICLERATRPKEVLEWSQWLGDTLMRQHRYAEAWPYLDGFEQLPEGDARLLVVGYCAYLTGRVAEAERAYARFAATSSVSDAWAVVAAGHLALQNDAEAVRVLEQSAGVAEAGAGVRTSSLEVLYQANLRLGRIDSALTYLQEASQREDRSSWVRSTLAQVTDLLGDATQALPRYRDIEPGNRGALQVFREASLLRDLEGVEPAVRRMLERYPREGLHGVLRELDVDLDPQFSALVAKYEAVDTAEAALAVLDELQIRASSMYATTRINLELAHVAASVEAWGVAWQALERAQDYKLPVINLASDFNRRPMGNRDMRYNEMVAVESVQSHVVVYESFHGSNTACNPLALCLALLQDTRFHHLRHVWIVKAGAPIHPELLQSSRVAFVRKGSTGHLRHLATAKWLVNNSTFEPFFSRRPEQRYLNTWHGIPWKRMGKDNLQEPYGYANVSRNVRHATHVLAPDVHTLATLTDSMDCELSAGAESIVGPYPRLELGRFLPDAAKQQLRGELGVSAGEKLVIYMPTWQGEIDDRRVAIEETLSNAEGLVAAGYRVALRAHHFVAEQFETVAEVPGVVLIPEHLDTNELLGVADVLVTDFSSVLFDAAAVGVPVVKLLTTFDRYAAERGVYFTPEEVPGSNAYTLDAAKEQIVGALRDAELHKGMYRDQVDRFGGELDAPASASVIDVFMREACAGEPSSAGVSAGSRDVDPVLDDILISVGGLRPNGITRALRSLVISLAGVGKRPTVMVAPSSLPFATAETLADLRAYAGYLFVTGGAAGTRMEAEMLRFFSTPQFRSSVLSERYLVSGRKREARRVFGGRVIGAAVEFDGYSAQRVALIAMGSPVLRRKGVILHNEMWKERSDRFPRLEPGLRVLGAYDFIGSVSRGVMEENARELSENLGVSSDLHVLTENTINAEEILELSTQPLEREHTDWYERSGVHACIIGRLSPEKNHAMLLSAYAASLSELAEPVLVTIVGDGPLRVQLEAQRDALGLVDRVRFIGQSSNPYAHIAASDVMFLPSTHEGQPLVILEALTVGTPVIATDIPGSRSVLRGGEYGTLVPVNQDGLEAAVIQASERNFTRAHEFNPHQISADATEMFLQALRN